jgi:hypothetical protein
MTFGGATKGSCHGNREAGSIARVPVLTLAACFTMGDQAWWWHLVLGAGPRALYVRMHFDQGVLDHIGANRPLGACPTIETGPHDRDR